VIQESVKQPLAEELLFGRLANGGTVLVDHDTETDKLRFAFPDAPAKGKKGQKGEKPTEPVEG